MPAKKIYAPEIIIGARQDYADGVPAEHIAAKWGMSTGALYKWVNGEVAGMNLLPLRKRRPCVRRIRPPKGARLAVIRRLWDAAAQQVRELHVRLATMQPPAEREADTRLLSVLVRTLRDLDVLDPRKESATPPGTAAAKDHEADVRDIDEFRRDLVRKMDAVIAARAEAGDGKVHES
jgi:hypothetical protein